MTEENTHAYQAADAQFKHDVNEEYERRVEAAKSSHRSRGGGDSQGPGVTATDQNQPLPDGMRGPGEPRGSGPKVPPPAITSLDKLVPPALDFAAPPTGGLILQRMSGSVLFGRTDNDDLVMLPLSGEADLPRGMRGSISEDGDKLRLLVQMPNGEVVQYTYHPDAEPSGRVMVVDISVLGALPGRNVEFRRLYRRAQVNVGELKKAGQ
jgi:hypothetical protein